jgi:pantothenate kinase
LTAALAAAGVEVALLPMDGFHLADASLEGLGLLDRKGAIATFDGHGYLNTLRRVKARPGHIVYAPAFERDLDQPTAAAIGVGPEVDLVVTEGNYLLAPQAPWRSVAACLDEVWYCDLPAATRVDRLVARHIRFGKAPDAARAFVARVDQANADQVAAWRPRADLRVDVEALGLGPRLP